MDRHDSPCTVLLIENVLPRLQELEVQLLELRRATWPVCQGISDDSAGGIFTNLIAKRKFFSSLTTDEILLLLELKARHMNRDVDLVKDELDELALTKS